MRLVDTSVWIAFFRGRAEASELATLLESGDLLVHPWVIGELALGSLGRHRAAVIADLQRLSFAPIVEDGAVLELIEDRGLAGSGIGWVDAQLLASARAAHVSLWTLDARLAALARSFTP